MSDNSASKLLVENSVASRIGAGDASLYDFSEDAMECAAQFMGWRDLASRPPVSPGSIISFARQARNDGLNKVVLLGQGGSTQAPMTITKYDKQDRGNVTFRIIDSVSPVRVREFLETTNPFETLLLVSSKSGGTIEPNSLLIAIKQAFAPILGEELPNHLVAITDPGSSLEKMAQEEAWRKIFYGKESVGGRYSALSVFGLVPAALTGIDIIKFLEFAADAEEQCRADVTSNPAVELAAFLFENYERGRNKFSFLTPKRGRVLGLWIEQLVAESLGKNGKGITPNIEIDSLLLSKDTGDRTAIMYETETDFWDEKASFELSLKYIDENIPVKKFSISSVYELAQHFVIWEYAIAMCGWLMKICPFDQPDVASAKAATLKVLEEENLDRGRKVSYAEEAYMGEALVFASDAIPECDTLHESIRALFESIEPGDYFSVNAFLPFTGEGRREALDKIRSSVAHAFGVMSCLEIGPRFLHSTGQLQKGGPNNGVFLIVSASELKDIELGDHAKAPTLGTLAHAQAIGDMQILSERGRRALHIHLPNNSGVAIRLLNHIVRDVIDDMIIEKQAK